MSNPDHPQIQRLIRQLENTYSGQPWYGDGTLASLQKITAEQSFRALIPGKKSIAEILRHMVAWRLFLIEHLQGNSSYRIELDSVQDWPPVRGMSWEDLLAELARSQQTIVETLAGYGDNLLEQELSNGTDRYNYRFLIEGVIQHDIYHLGQINLVRAVLEAH